VSNNLRLTKSSAEKLVKDLCYGLSTNTVIKRMHLDGGIEFERHGEFKTTITRFCSGGALQKFINQLSEFIANM